MVGQIIETYAAQIAYFEGGPGALYNPENRNIANRFCKENETSEGADTEKVDNLKCEIKKLRNELKSMQERIEILEGRNNE
ncbi:MAG: hypothetical protein E7214_08510 [Clostridium sp.]|nr:hypothetical protein [Clostridium sp.]